MAINSRVFPLTVFMLACASYLGAQAGRSQVEVRFIQHLAWNEDENTFRYEVIIERDQNGRYTSQQREFTPVSYIDVTLPPGNYRYRVIPYNFLNRPGDGSQWVYIEVRPALRPGVNFSSGILYLDGRKEYVLNISGENIEHDASIELRSAGGVSIVPYKKNIPPDGSNADLYFKEEQLTPGVYEIYIRNLSGLETSGGVITIAYPEPEIAGKGERPDSRLNTIGASIGTSFAAPLFIVTLHGTYAPWRYSFLEAGIDLGFGCAGSDVKYYSFYPFVHYSAFFPFTEKLGIYAGAGGGFMAASYKFPEGDVWFNTPATDFIAGLNIKSVIDISYTLRTGFKGINHKISAGYVYRFGVSK